MRNYAILSSVREKVFLAGNHLENGNQCWNPNGKECKINQRCTIWVLTFVAAWTSWSTVGSILVVWGECFVCWLDLSLHWCCLFFSLEASSSCINCGDSTCDSDCRLCWSSSAWVGTIGSDDLVLTVLFPELVHFVLMILVVLLKCGKLEMFLDLCQSRVSLHKLLRCSELFHCSHDIYGI